MHSYGYDEFGRLAALAVSSGPAGNYTYTYDRWVIIQPDRNERERRSTAELHFQFLDQLADWVHIRLSWKYDQQWQDSYTYDAEGNLVKVDSGNTATYTYDGLNHRVRIDRGPNWAQEFIFNPLGQRAPTGTQTTTGNKPVGLTGAHCLYRSTTAERRS